MFTASDKMTEFKFEIYYIQMIDSLVLEMLFQVEFSSWSSSWILVSDFELDFKLVFKLDLVLSRMLLQRIAQEQRTYIATIQILLQKVIPFS